MKLTSIISLCSAAALTAIVPTTASAQSGFSITIGSGGNNFPSSGYNGYNGYRHGGAYDGYDGWNNGGDTYAEFQQEYQYVLGVIQHGLRDGTIPRYQAQQYYRELQSIRRAAYYDQLQGGYEGDYVQERLERLHARVDARHDDNHDRQDGYYNPYQR